MVTFLIHDVAEVLSHLAASGDNPAMNATRSIYRGFRFPVEIGWESVTSVRWMLVHARIVRH